MKKLVLFISLLSLSISAFCQNNNATIKFLKGNISEKTSAVTNASGAEAAALSSRAITFVLDTKDILGDDRELDALAVAAILSISPDYVKKQSDNEKKYLESQLVQMFKKFNTIPNVQITILSKLGYINDYISTDNFTVLLNNFLKTSNIHTVDSGLFDASLKLLEKIGNNETFLILYTFLNNENYEKYDSQIKKTISKLVPASMNEILSLIHNKSESKQIRTLFELVKENSKISKNNLCEIAENILVESILLVGDSSKVTYDDIALQLDALKILKDNKWTRASSICISYFKYAKELYDIGSLNESQFKEVINSLSSIAPIASVTPLTDYLVELNSLKEKGKDVSSEILLAVINSLGAIGDKSAFDSLLAVTYLNYEESVLAAARKALSGLRWQ